VKSIFNSIGDIAAGKIGSAIKYIEKMLGLGLTLLMTFLARFVGLGGIAKKIKEVLTKLGNKVRNAIKKAAKKIAKKIKGWFGKSKGGKKKVSDKELKEDEKLSPDQQKQKEEVRKGLTYLHAQEKKVDTDKDDDLSREQAEEVARKTKKKFKVFKWIKVVEKGKKWAFNYRYNPEKTEEGDKKKDVGVPDRRYIPFKPEGEFIRETLYFAGFWKTISKNLKANKKPKIIKLVHQVMESDKSESKKLREWARLQRIGLVEKGADIKSYDPSTIHYQVDHKEDLSIRWNNKGFDSGDQTRYRQLSEDGNLATVTRQFNRAKSRTRYNIFVGKNFSSKKSNSEKGSNKINGKPFLDASGKKI